MPRRGVWAVSTTVRPGGERTSTRVPRAPSGDPRRSLRNCLPGPFTVDRPGFHCSPLHIVNVIPRPLPLSKHVASTQARIGDAFLLIALPKTRDLDARAQQVFSPFPTGMPKHKVPYPCCRTGSCCAAFVGRFCGRVPNSHPHSNTDRRSKMASTQERRGEFIYEYALQFTQWSSMASRQIPCFRVRRCLRRGPPVRRLFPRGRSPGPK